MKYYMNKNTGVLFTQDEVETLWDQYKEEMEFDTFEDFLDTLEEKEKAYTVFFVAGERDGETLGEFDTITEAIKFAQEFQEQHKNEFDDLCGGVGIADPDGNEVEW